MARVDPHAVHFTASEQARIRECIQALRISYNDFMREGVLALVSQCEGIASESPRLRRLFAEYAQRLEEGDAGS